MANVNAFDFFRGNGCSLYGARANEAMKKKRSEKLENFIDHFEAVIEQKTDRRIHDIRVFLSAHQDDINCLYQEIESIHECDEKNNRFPFGWDMWDVLFVSLISAFIATIANIIGGAL